VELTDCRTAGRAGEKNDGAGVRSAEDEKNRGASDERRSLSIISKLD